MNTATCDENPCQTQSEKLRPGAAARLGSVQLGSMTEQLLLGGLWTTASTVALLCHQNGRDDGLRFTESPRRVHLRGRAARSRLRLHAGMYRTYRDRMCCWPSPTRVHAGFHSYLPASCFHVEAQSSECCISILLGVQQFLYRTHVPPVFLLHAAGRVSRLSESTVRCRRCLQQLEPEMKSEIRNQKSAFGSPRFVSRGARDPLSADYPREDGWRLALSRFLSRSRPPDRCDMDPVRPPPPNVSAYVPYVGQTITTHRR